MNCSNAIGAILEKAKILNLTTAEVGNMNKRGGQLILRWRGGDKRHLNN